MAVPEAWINMEVNKESETNITFTASPPYLQMSPTSLFRTFREVLYLSFPPLTKQEYQSGMDYN